MAMFPPPNFQQVNGTNNVPQVNFHNSNFQLPPPPLVTPQAVNPPRPPVAMHVVPEQMNVPRINVDPVTAFSQVIPSLVARPPPPMQTATNLTAPPPCSFQQTASNWNPERANLNNPRPAIPNQNTISWNNQQGNFNNPVSITPNQQPNGQIMTHNRHPQFSTTLPNSINGPPPQQNNFQPSAISPLANNSPQFNQYQFNQPIVTNQVPPQMNFNNPLKNNYNVVSTSSNSNPIQNVNNSMYNNSNSFNSQPIQNVGNSNVPSFNSFHSQPVQNVFNNSAPNFGLNNFNSSIPVHQNKSSSVSNNINWKSPNRNSRYQNGNNWNNRPQSQSFIKSISLDHSNQNSASHYSQNSKDFNCTNNSSNSPNFFRQQNSKLGCYSPSESKPIGQQNTKLGCFSSSEIQPFSNSRYDHSNRTFQRPMNFSKSFQGNSFNRNSNNQNGGYYKKTFDASSQPFSCDTCDRGFSTESELKSHMDEHVICNIRNCQFQAHPKIVAIHKKMQHDTGYAEAISKLKNADEIAKWRAERRRRFPTAENILKRKAEQVEREARGEVIETKEFGQFKRKNNEGGPRGRNKRFRSNQRRRGFEKREYQHSIARAPRVATVSDSDSDDDSHIKLRPFLGMKAPFPTDDDLQVKSPEPNTTQSVDAKIVDLSVENENDDVVSVGNPLNDEKNNDGMNNKSDIVEKSDEEIIEEIKSDNEVHIIQNESIDSDDEGPEEIPIVKTTLENSAVVETDLGHNKVTCLESDNEAPEEIPIVKATLTDTCAENVDEPLTVQKNGNEVPKDSNEDSESKPSDRNFAGNNRGRRPGRGRNNRFPHNKEPYVPPVRSSLLEKLLASDIRHERNVVMQCIRHIVNKGFFEDE